MSRYILDFIPYQNDSYNIDRLADIEKRISQNASITEAEAEDFLAELMYITRKKINPHMDQFDYKCDLAQSMICHYFESIGKKTTPCSTLRQISENADGHNFTIVSLNVEGEERKYLLDPTYIQFFKEENCNASKYFISPQYPDRPLLTPDPGYFVSPENYDVVSFILKYGYIELTEEYAKIYGDSFYDARVGAPLNSTMSCPISGQVYINSFTKGHERLSKTREELIADNRNIETFAKQKASAK